MKGKLIIAILVGLISVSAFARDQLGLGLIVGEPTGLSVKYWLDEEHAIDGGIAWSFWDEDGFQLHADYLWHFFELIQPEEANGKLPVYVGVGGRLKFEEDNGRRDADDGDTVFGIRAPVGISYMFDGKPVDLFAEVAPILDLSPDVEINFSVAVGVRFYIK